MKPGEVELIAPSGNVSNASTLRFTWNIEPRAAWYEFCLTKNGRIYVDEWRAASGSATDAASGQFGMDVAAYGSGNYQWWVRAWNPDGMGPWSPGMTFTVAASTPSAATLISPTGTIAPSKPTFEWNAQGATWYCIWIHKDNAKYYSTWVNTKTWTPWWTLPAGNYSWWVQTWNPDGYGPWSATGSFRVTTSNF